MTRFQTLMRREWMQHHRAWLLIVLLPPTLLLALGGFGQIELGQPVKPLLLVLFATALCTFGVFAVFAVATVFQLPGLARRDAQDRSIEFWLSLPTGHAASVGATLLMHLVVMPLVALGIGCLFGQALGLTVVARIAGLAAWVDLPWGMLLVDELLALLSLAFGLMVGLLWLLPLLLLTMVASAWLKRWGTAALALTLAVGHAVLAKVYGIQIVGETIQALVYNAASTIVNDGGGRLSPHDAESAAAWLQHAPAWLWQDALATVANLAQPLFAFALLFSAGCFGLLVLRRRQP